MLLERPVAMLPGYQAEVNDKGITTCRAWIQITLKLLA